MTGMQAWLGQLHEALDRGDAAAARDVLHRHPPQTPLEHVIAACTALELGDLHRAEAWVDQLPDGVERALMSATLGVHSRLAIDHAVAVWRDLPVLDCPLLRLVALRLAQSARVYQVLTPEEDAALTPAMQPLIDDLAEAGFFREAEGLALSFAEAHQADFRARFAEESRDAGRFVFAAQLEDGLATELLNDPSSQAVFDQQLAQARADYAACGHLTGPLLCDHMQARWDVLHGGAAPERLVITAEALVAADARRLAISAYLDASQMAHRYGAQEILREVRERLITLSEETGMVSIKVNTVMSAADTATRNGLSAHARDLLDSVYHNDLPASLKASILILRGSAGSLLGDKTGAVEDRRLAVSLLGQDGLGLYSDLAPALASDLSSLKEWREADEVLRDAADRDRAAGHPIAALRKDLQRAQMRVVAMSRDPVGAAKALGEGSLKDAAQALMDQVVDQIPTDLPMAEKLRLMDDLVMVEGQLATVTNDPARARARFLDWSETLDQPEMKLEWANKRLLVGLFDLNLVNDLSDDSFAGVADSARKFIGEALDVYVEGGYRREAASAAHKLAMLYLNVQHRLPAEAAKTITDQAAELLSEAAGDVDALRRAYGAEDRAGAFEGKASFSAQAGEIAQEALGLHLGLVPNAQEAWRWAVESKARGLGDLLGADSRVPAELASAMDGDAKLARTVEAERQLARDLADAPAAKRAEVSAALEQVRNTLRAQPAAQAYAERRSGAPVGVAEFEAAFARAPAAVMVDWVSAAGWLWLILR
ncbi:MAG: hypothetical protein AAGH17_08885, partial [Pseudomonadota bacterium]